MIAGDNDEIKMVRDALIDALNDLPSIEAEHGIIGVIQTAAICVAELSGDRIKNLQWALKNFVIAYSQYTDLDIDLDLVSNGVQH